VRKIDINSSNLDLLSFFLKKIEESKKTFRYFENRSFDCLSNHIITRLYFNQENECVGYGHLDLENIVWLGICIADEHKGKGYSNFIMNDLLTSSNQDVYLTVDAENKIAINLYKKYGFIIEKFLDDKYLMKKSLKMDSLGNVIDKLVTVDMKMWNNQELLYEIRRMTFDEFKEKYFLSEEGSQKLWDILKKACDLNVQRNQLINEVDEKIIQMFEALKNGEELDNGKFLQRSHKTY
jgi:hypothetical protein